MKAAIKETALFALIIFSALIFAASFTSCSKEDDVKPAFKKDLYTVAVSASASIATGIYEGDYYGDVETAKQYLNAGEIVKPGAIVSVQVAKGETLFVKVDSNSTFDFVVKKNGNEVIGLAGVAGGKTYIFSNK